MTKSELAAQKCADLANEVAKRTGLNYMWPASAFEDRPGNADHVAYREFREHVSDLCEQAIASGDTSGLEALVLREPVDPADEAEAKKFAESWAPEMVTPYAPARLERLEGFALTALRRGREIERGEG